MLFLYVGMFWSTRDRTYITGNRKVGAAHPSMTTSSTNAVNNIAMMTNNYDKVAKNSPTATLGEHVEGGDIIILRLLQQQGAMYGEESTLNEKMDDR